MGIVGVLASKPLERSPSVPGDADTTHASHLVPLETALSGWPLMASEDALETALGATAPPDMAPGPAPGTTRVWKSLATTRPARGMFHEVKCT